MKSEKKDKFVTVSDILNWGVRKLKGSDIYLGHGTDNIWDEAVFLILYALQLPPDTDKSVLKKILTDQEKRHIIEMFKMRIKEHIPAPYLTHEAWFAGLPFYVDERVLIPRSPIAELIESQFSPWIAEDKVHRILDIGTGSGCIAIACAYAFPHAKIDAADINDDALKVAAINVAKHNCGKQVNIIKSDVFSNLRGEIYDIIISNPPYVSQNEMQTLPKEYSHEPKSALEAGKDGLDIVTRILRESYQHLSQEGILVVEVGNSAEALIKKFPKLPLVWLEFESGEAEVFLLTREELRNVQSK